MTIDSNSADMPVPHTSPRQPMLRWSWTGFVMAVTYLYLCVGSITIAGGLSGRTPGQREWLWYPLALQTWLLDQTGLGWMMDCTSWRNAYLQVGGATVVVLLVLGYGIDWGLRRLTQRSGR
jgi:hypothetical protein